MFLKPFISAPIDIMIMLLVAFIIGFVIAWLLRKLKINDIHEEALRLENEIRNLNISNENLDIANNKIQEELEICLESKRNLVNLEELQQATLELKKERERSETARQSLMEIERAHEALKQELQLKIDQMLTPEEANKLRAEVNRLRVFNTNLEEEIQALKWNQQHERDNIAENPSSTDEISPFASHEQDFLASIGIKTAAAHEKDDLKKISGVGPFIEEKLNRIGIYTFEQIASMTQEQVDKVTEAIEFFPGRIQRDDWVSQASRLLGTGE